MELNGIRVVAFKAPKKMTEIKSLQQLLFSNIMAWVL